MFEKWDVKFKSFPYLTRLTIGVAGLIIVAIIDYFTGPVLSAAFFYMVPVIYFGWYVGRFHGVLVAMISAVIWLGSDLMSGFEGVHPGIPYWNALVRLAVFLIVAVILVRLQEELRLQRETNEKLEKANAEITRLAAIKSDFISLVSHELRTPLTVIKESVNIVHDGSAGPVNAEQKDFLETVDRNARRLARLINDVLDFQKLESGRMDYKMTRGDINEVLEEVGRGFRVVAEKKGLGFELQKADRLPEVTFDHDKITQVLTNLLNKIGRAHV